jgi:hypothetical protein
MEDLDQIIKDKKQKAGILEYVFGTIAVASAVPAVLAYYICVFFISTVKIAVRKIGNKF